MRPLKELDSIPRSEWTPEEMRHHSPPSPARITAIPGEQSLKIEYDYGGNVNLGKDLQTEIGRGPIWEGGLELQAEANKTGKEQFKVSYSENSEKVYGNKPKFTVGPKIVSGAPVEAAQVGSGSTVVDQKTNTNNRHWNKVKDTISEAAGPYAHHVWNRFKDSRPGKLWSPLSRTNKIIIGVGASMMALGIVRTMWKMLQPNMQPPPAFQGSYGTLEGLPKQGLGPHMNNAYSDFGSPLRLNKAANRPILGHISPSRNRSRQHAGVVQGMM